MRQTELRNELMNNVCCNIQIETGAGDRTSLCGNGVQDNNQ